MPPLSGALSAPNLASPPLSLMNNTRVLSASGPLLDRLDHQFHIGVQGGDHCGVAAAVVVLNAGVSRQSAFWRLQRRVWRTVGEIQEEGLARRVVLEQADGFRSQQVGGGGAAFAALVAQIVPTQIVG